MFETQNTKKEEIFFYEMRNEILKLGTHNIQRDTNSQKALLFSPKILKQAVSSIRVLKINDTNKK